MGHSIIVASAKGGVGKTNTIINIGAALARQGKKVALIDGSLTTPDISLHLGIPFHVRGLAHILKENAPMESAVFHHNSGMQVIPGNIHLNVLKEFEGKKFKKLIKKLKKQFDYVLVDSAAGIGREALSAMKHCDKMLLVVNPELTSAVNASKAIQIAKKHKVKPIGVILNRVGRHKKELKINEIAHLMHKVPIIGLIKEDKRVPNAISNTVTMIDQYPYSKIGREYTRIAQGIMPKRSSVALTTKPWKSFIMRIFDFLHE